jgi:hypothetical protein
MAFHVHGQPAKIPCLYQTSHFPRHRAELGIMPDSHLPPCTICGIDKNVRLLSVDRERLLDEEVTTVLKTP